MQEEHCYDSPEKNLNSFMQSPYNKNYIVDQMKNFRVCNDSPYIQLRPIAPKMTDEEREKEIKGYIKGFSSEVYLKKRPFPSDEHRMLFGGGDDEIFG